MSYNTFFLLSLVLLALIGGAFGLTLGLWGMFPSAVVGLAWGWNAPKVYDKLFG